MNAAEHERCRKYVDGLTGHDLVHHLEFYAKCLVLCTFLQSSLKQEVETLLLMVEYQILNSASGSLMTRDLISSIKSHSKMLADYDFTGFTCSWRGDFDKALLNSKKDLALLLNSREPVFSVITRDIHLMLIATHCIFPKEVAFV